MTLQNLKYMLEISNSHSFSKAAKNLFVSQSTLSAAVKELESDLGITIFKTDKSWRFPYLRWRRLY